MSVRIQATDLREAARKSAAARAEAVARGAEAAQVYLDVEVVIERSVAAAFAAAEHLATPRGMRYIGTPRGLAGLISDVQRLEIADGVVLVTASEGQVVDLMLGELAPGLGSARAA